MLSGDHGGDDKTYLKEYEKNGIDPNRVIFTGKYNRDNVFDILSCFDVYFYTPNAESFGYSMVEAMSAGVPVVCSDVGAINETINHMDNGFLLNDNYDEAVDFISKIIEDSSLKGRISKSAIDFVSNRHSVDIFTKNIFSIFV
jgi:glycosyltransferase involved in cell wall biosynthesis